MTKERRHFTAQQKVAILRRHLVDKVPVSEVCEESGLQPTVFYRWQKELLEKGAVVFGYHSPGQQRGSERKVAALEAKLRQKDEVLAELMAEPVALKKSLGGL
jgi:transposase